MLPGQGAYDVFGLRRSVENYSLANKPVVTLGKRGKSLVEWTDLIGWADIFTLTAKERYKTKWSDYVDIRKHKTETNSKIVKIV